MPDIDNDNESDLVRHHWDTERQVLRCNQRASTIDAHSADLAACDSHSLAFFDSDGASDGGSKD